MTSEHPRASWEGGKSGSPTEMFWPWAEDRSSDGVGRSLRGAAIQDLGDTVAERRRHERLPQELPRDRYRGARDHLLRRVPGHEQHAEFGPQRAKTVGKIGPVD